MRALRSHGLDDALDPLGRLLALPLEELLRLCAAWRELLQLEPRVLAKLCPAIIAVAVIRPAVADAIEVQAIDLRILRDRLGVELGEQLLAVGVRWTERVEITEA